MTTIYEKLGPEQLDRLVENFYTLVLQNETLIPLFQTDIEVVKEKQRAFLTQFLGGPMRYSETYGHPRMRMRHLPHRITAEAASEWLRCMAEAIDQLDVEEDFKDVLFNCFPKVAAHMVNS